jgi:hypothetical protein
MRPKRLLARKVSTKLQSTWRKPVRGAQRFQRTVHIVRSTSKWPGSVLGSQNERRFDPGDPSYSK